MGKSVYSLVLMDEVVEKIDEEAYQMGTSRSNLINQILADYVSYTTPQKQVEGIFSSLENMFKEMNTFQVLANPSPYFMNITSSLRYKYRPTIKYGVELYDNSKYSFGELKVTLRTTNQSLIRDMNQFLKFYAQLEEKYIRGILEENLCYKIEEKKYTRQFVLPKERGVDKVDLGVLIGEYIKVFDSVLKVFLSELPYTQDACQDAEKEYITLMQKVHAII
ncbi:CopG family transcriptional regulator [Anaerofustis sp.]|uniref:ribbon-helix-helix domain-containing protein n=1 Tax=Anaerofustis sp. TaxID=1872517 RepID=UPI0025C5E1A4|nr:CopG family transcriptional regulator [Anaerofustis sp.]